MRLPSLFSDHMVMQRDGPVPVWGWTRPGARVRVRLGVATAETVADADGFFRAVLPPMPAGGPHELQVEGPERVTRRDVFVGEVWVCSGQSNMQWPVSCSMNPEEETRSADHPAVRFFTVPNNACGETLSDVPAAWQVCSPDTVGPFSAVAYYFGRELYRTLGVPVGLIHASWGGTRIEAWMSREALAADPVARRELTEYEAYRTTEQARTEAEAYRNLPLDPVERMRRAAVPDPGNEGAARGWADPALQDLDWPVMTLPCGWQQAGHNISGVFWFRREVFVPAAWAGRDLVLRLGACDKHDSTYFNNEPVGGLGMEIPDAWSTRRIYRVPGRHVRAGRNLVAVRVYSYMYQGGMIGPAAQMRLEPADEPAAAPVALDGDWRYRIEHDFGFVAPPVLSSGPGNHNSPHILFDSMIHPLLPYASRGVLWYQGEGNCERAAHYRALLPALIRDWRAAWNSPGLSFFFVQLANHGPRLELPGESLWAELRETQLEARTLPGTAMAVTIDIGDAADIHPVNKQEVGRRLALAARALIFGEKLVHSGPVLRSWAVEGGAVRLEFDSMGGGLATSDGRSPIGFAVAGRDRMFHCAGARIEGDTVVVRADEIPAPLAVRYAWADNPDCNLVNREGLPASPFRTDEWPGRTASCAS